MYIVNVEGAIYHKGRFLIIRRGMNEEHAAGMLSLVGGKVETIGAFTSVVEDTLIREIDEEVGVKIKSTMKYVCSTSFSISDNLNVINLVFLCEPAFGEIHPRSSQEVEEVLWMTKAEVLTSAEAPIYLKESIEAADQVINLENCEK